MFLVIFISSSLMLFFMMLGLGLKWFFHTSSGFPVRSCGLEGGEKDDNSVCTTCGLKNLIDCAEVKVSHQNVVAKS